MKKEDESSEGNYRKNNCYFSDGRGTKGDRMGTERAKTGMQANRNGI